MSLNFFASRLALPLTVLLLASCGGGGSKSDDTGTDPSTSGAETLGMGETSVTAPTTSTAPSGTTESNPSDPTSPGTITLSEPTTLSGADTTDTTAPPPDTTDTTDTTSTTSTTSDDTSTTSTTSTTSDECMDIPAQPQDTPCTDASGCGCTSGQCFIMPILGGWCSQCKVDADCVGGGCTTPNPLAGTGAVCNLGKPGDGCQTDAVCSEPGFQHCGVILEVPNIFTTSTCGECNTNADCPDNNNNCSPAYDLENFAGTFHCVADGSVANDNGCNLQDNGGQPVGNQACKSGFCGEANVMGLLKMGICGQCNSNADCDPGKTCTDPQVDLDNSVLIGATCI